ncbi:hypothetical protein LSAT2_024756 [Lamellibrachia satsuma]|nr:hypothetical protein LSAT2_024756 [Lamellibrachia satsuma]
MIDGEAAADSVSVQMSMPEPELGGINASGGTMGQNPGVPFPARDAVAPLSIGFKDDIAALPSPGFRNSVVAPPSLGFKDNFEERSSTGLKDQGPNNNSGSMNEKVCQDSVSVHVLMAMPQPELIESNANAGHASCQQECPAALTGMPGCPYRYTRLPLQVRPAALTGKPGCPDRYARLQRQVRPAALSGTPGLRYAQLSCQVRPASADRYAQLPCQVCPVSADRYAQLPCQVRPASADRYAQLPCQVRPASADIYAQLPCQKNGEEPKLPLCDFVLVYKEDKNDANKAEKEKERRVFEENLKNYGMIIDPEEQSDDKSPDKETHYTKLHASWEVLAQMAKYTHTKVPVKVQSKATGGNSCGNQQVKNPNCFSKIPFNPFTSSLKDINENVYMAEFSDQCEQSCKFTSAQRSYMVYELLLRTRYSDTDKQKKGIVNYFLCSSSNGLVKATVKATKHLICGSCSNWVDFFKSGCEKAGG